MMPEGAPDASELTRRMAEEADPTAVSALPPESFEQIGKDEHYGYPIMRDKEGGTYVRINARKHGPTQQLVARFLKQWVNVSDIVAVQEGGKTAYYSKVMPLEKMSKPISEQELLADALLMNGLFGDYDHFGAGTVGNVHRDRKTNRAAFYDFEKAKTHVGQIWPTARQTGYLQTEYFYQLSEEMLSRLIEKIGRIEAYLQSDEGKQYLAELVKASGWTTEELFELPYDPGAGEEGQLERLRTTLLLNLERTRAAVRRVLNPSEIGKAA